MLLLSLTASPHPWWQPHPSNKWHICFQDKLCRFLTATQKISFSLHRSSSCDIFIGFFLVESLPPLPQSCQPSHWTLCFREPALELVTQLLPWFLPSSSLCLILGRGKEAGSILKKKFFNVFYWFEAPRECSLKQSGLYLALLLLLFLFLQV